MYITNLCSSFFALVVYKFCSLGHKNLLKAEQLLEFELHYVHFRNWTFKS